MSTDNLKVMLEATEQHADRGWNEAHEQEARAETAEARIAAFEAERDALAAENAALTKFIDDDCWVIDPDRDSYIDAAQCVPDTTATDAFLREQRAKGVEMALTVVSDFSNHICAGGEPEARQYEESIVLPHLDGIHDELTGIAAKLRAGKAV